MAGFGTWMSYQGYPVRRCVFRRERGIRGTFSFADIYAQDLFLKPYPPKVLGQDIRIQQDFKEMSQSLDLRPEGDLIMAEDVDDEKHPKVLRVPLFVEKIEVILQDDVTGFKAWRVHLVDERYFWTRGLLTRSRFNRRIPFSSDYDPNTLIDGKRLYLLDDVANQVASNIFRRPRLSHLSNSVKAAPLPADGIEYRPYAPACSILGQICVDTASVDPCLRMDRTVAIHAPGDGLVASCQITTQGVPSGENAVQIGEEYNLFKDGQGKKETFEFGYPADYVVIVGGPKVVRVELDNWIPVMVFGTGGRARVYPLNESLVRTLTRGRYGIAWLRKWILAPDAYLGAVGLQPIVATAFREQAWRYYQMPGAAVYKELPKFDADYFIKVADGSYIAIEADRKFQDYLERILEGEDDTEVKVFEAVPGPNKHMLPMYDLPTARYNHQKMVVYTYGFETEHKINQRTVEEINIDRQVQIQNAYRTQIEQQAALKFQTSPFGVNDPIKQLTRKLGEDIAGKREEDDVVFSPMFRDIDTMFPPNDKKIITLDYFQNNLNNLRVRAAESLLAIQFEDKAGIVYDHAVKEELRLRDALSGGVQADLYDIAKESVQIQIYEVEVAKKKPVAAPFTSLSAQVTLYKKMLQVTEAKWDALREKLKKVREDYIRKQTELKNNAEVGLRPGERKTVMRYKNNWQDNRTGEPQRLWDLEASIVDPNRGIIRLSRLPGHVADPTVSFAIDTEFLPGPVRVAFGVRVKPRVTAPAKIKDKPPEIPSVTGLSTNEAELRRQIIQIQSRELRKLLDEGATRKQFREHLGKLQAAYGNTSRGLNNDQIAQLRAPLMPADEDNVAEANKILTDEPSCWAKAWARTGGSPKEIELGTFPLDEAIQINKPDLDGSTIVSEGFPYVFAHLTRQEIINSTTYTFARPWAVNCDGLVASVEVRSREDGGFETIVTTGANYRRLLTKDGGSATVAPFARRLAIPPVDIVTPTPTPAPTLNPNEVQP